MWLSGLFSNIGTFISAVAAAWAMAQLTRSESLVALVQSATMLPMLLLALFAGTVADLYDRRMVAIFALLFAAIGAGALALLSLLDLITPGILLVLIFLIACGTSFYAPTWQALSREQVEPRDLASAIALNSMSYSIGRSVGPAVGGIVVATLGATAAFSVNALSFMPILLVLLFWRRAIKARTTPSVSVVRSVGIGIGYLWRAPAIRVTLIRTLVTMFCSSALLALLPLIAQRRLNGDASVYGILLGSFGFGAILGTMAVALLQGRIQNETIVRIASAITGIGMVVVAFSVWLPVSVPVLLLVGMAWTSLTCSFNVSAQSSAPGWMTARAVAAYQTCVGGGVALGSILWGNVAALFNSHTSLAVAGLSTLLTIGIGIVAPIPETSQPTDGDVAPD